MDHMGAAGYPRPSFAGRMVSVRHIALAYMDWVGEFLMEKVTCGLRNSVWTTTSCLA